MRVTPVSTLENFPINSTHAFIHVFAGVPGRQIVGKTVKDGSSAAYTREDHAAGIDKKLGADRTKPIDTPANRCRYRKLHPTEFALMMPIIEDDHVVEAFPANRSDHAFAVGILPG